MTTTTRPRPKAGEFFIGTNATGIPETVCAACLVPRDSASGRPVV